MKELLRRLEATLGPEGGGPSKIRHQLRSLVREISQAGPPAPADLQPLLPKLLEVARDYSYCEDDNDYHLACEAAELLGVLGLSEPRLLAAFEEQLLDAKPAECVQYATVRALHGIGTPEAVVILERTEERIWKWIAKSDCRRYRAFLAEVQRLLLRLKDR